MQNKNIILEEVVESNKNKKTRTVTTGKIYHSSLFRNDIRTADELVARLGRQWKHNLANLLTLCRIVEQETQENIYNEIAIACTAPIMLQHFGCVKSASNIIKLAEKIDLLFCTSREYYYNNNKSTSKCRGYIVNKSMSSLVQDCCISYNIGVENNKNKNESASEIKDSSSQPLNIISSSPLLPISCNLHSVRFSCHHRLPKTLTDKDIRNALYQQYPLLQHYQNLAKQINQKYYADSPKLQIRFAPTIHRSSKGYITKIGIRAASSVCGLPKVVDEASEVPTRGDFFRAYFGNTPVYEYDIKSSIYRVAHLMRNHEWLDDSVDFYERMAGREFANAEQRANFKRLSMSLYFGGTPREVTHHLIDRCPHLRAYPKEEIVTAITEAQERMFAVVGESMDTEVFFHESCICMDLLARLLKRGLRVVQVYDGFYSDDPRLGEFCTEWLPEIATDYWVSCTIERAYQDDKNPTC